MIVSKINSSDYSIIQILKQLNSQKLNINQIQFNNFIDNLLPNHHIYIGKIDNQIVACGSLIIEFKIIHNLGKVGHIEDVVIDKDHRRKGLGKQIIDFLVSKAKEIGCYKVILNCSNNNQVFYENCNFIKKENQMVKYLI